MEGDSRQRYFLPLAAIWSAAESEVRQGLLPVTLAELRQLRKEGVLVDALSQDGFLLSVMDAIGRESDDTVQRRRNPFSQNRELRADEPAG